MVTPIPTRTVTIPGHLPQDVLRWRKGHVEDFLKANKAEYELEDAQIQVPTDREIAGLDLINITLEVLESYGLTGSPAQRILLLKNDLTVAKGYAPVESYPLIESDVIRSSVAIILPHHNKAKPTMDDVFLNRIILEDEVGTLDQLPAHAKQFIQQLTKRVPITLNDKTKHHVEILKDALGPQVFEQKFILDDLDEERTPATMRELSSYVHALGQLENGLQYYAHFTALAKEVCLASVIVDPAINILGRAYNHDKYHAFIELKQAADAKPDDVWCPRNDFRVAFGVNGLGYALLHGETDSKGQTEGDAMYKNALLSLHSWRSMHEIRDVEDPVILYVYISVSICSMYIFFEDKSAKRFRFPCILKEDFMFNSEHKVVEFLRRLHNFAIIAKKHQNSPPVAQANKHDAMMLVTPPPNTRRTNEDKDGSDRPKKRSNKQKSSASGDLNASTTTMALYALGFTVDRAWSERGMTTLKKSNCRFTAKRITRDPELQILKYLESVSSSTHRNHTIPITNIHPLGVDYFLIIMPLFTVLSEVRNLTKPGYFHIESQLVEGVAFLHENGVVHRDIKPDNVVVDFTTSRFGKLYLIDYDLARWHLSGTLRCTGYLGTEDWTAPEIQDGAKWDPMPADVWATAKTLEHTAKHAFVDDNSHLNLPLSPDPSLRPNAAEFLVIVLRYRQRKRSASQLLEERDPKRIVQETKDNQTAICH